MRKLIILLAFGLLALTARTQVIEYYLPEEDIYPVEVQIFRDTIIYRVLTIEEGTWVLLDTNTIWLQHLDTIWEYKDPLIPWEPFEPDTTGEFFKTYKFFEE